MSRRRRDSEERGSRRRSRSRSPVAEAQRNRRVVHDGAGAKSGSANVQRENVQWNQSDDKGLKTVARRADFDRDREGRGRREDRRENASFGTQREWDDSARSQPGRFDRGPSNRGNFDNSASYNDRRFDNRGGGSVPMKSRLGQMRGNYHSGGGGGYGAGGSDFGSQRRGGARFARGRGGQDRGTVVYRPGEKDETPKLNLFDPTKVPKGRSYFSHDDRERDDDRWSFRPSRGRGRPYGWRTDDDRGGAPMPMRRRSPTSFGRRPVEDVWKHDMFNDAEDTDNGAVHGAKASAADVDESTASIAIDQ